MRLVFLTSTLFGLLGGALPVAARTQTVVDTVDVAVRSPARLDLHTVKGDVRIRNWDREQVRVIASHPRSAAVRVDASGSVVDIHAERGHDDPIDYTITVPITMDLDIHGVDTSVVVEGTQGRLDIQTVKGAVEVRGGRSAIHLSSVQGSISLSGARGRVDLQSVNQSITATDVVGDLEAQTVNGGIRLTRIDARTVQASTVNGRIIYDGALKPDGWYRFNSHNGGIDLVVPPDAGASVRVSTFNGELKPAFPIRVSRSRDARQFEFTLGSGGARIEIESFNGTVRLLRPEQQ